MNMSAVSAGPHVSNLDGVVALVSEEMKVVEARLAERMESPIGSIPQVGAHLLGAGGKRLRPLLAVLAARATGAPLDHAVAVGCAAELIHTATLYHDDVVDDGRVRRGRPAARMVFGNGVVVLVGDFCLARAASTASSGRSRFPPAPSRWAPTCGMEPIGLSMRSARRASTSFISSLTRATIPSRLDVVGPADTADIFITDPAPVTTFLNIQKELKYARKIAAPGACFQGAVLSARTPT